MPQFDIAHIKVQGKDVILIALDSLFGQKTNAEKKEALAEFELRCHAAGLSGGVAILWRGGFIGPENWRPFLRSIDINYAVANRNRTISW